MAEKLKTVSNRGLIWIIVVLSIVIIILVLSGLKKINPLLLFFSLAGLFAFIYFYFRKPKEKDFYAMLKKIKERHYEETKYSLDVEGAQALPVTDDITYFYLPMEAKTFEVKGNVVKGIVTRHLLKAVKEKEKSRLFSESIKYSGAEARIKQAAEASNIDIESLGLE